MTEKYAKLMETLRISKLYSHAGTLEYWDMETGMPKEGFEQHSDTAEFLGTENFKLMTSPELGELLTQLNAPEEYDLLDEKGKFIVKKMKEDYDRDARVPVDFYSAYIREMNESGKAWKEAKLASDFSIFAPHLEKMIEMSRQNAEYRYPGVDPYDAMLSMYTRGIDCDAIDRVFTELKEGLVPLIRRITASVQPDDSIFEKTYDINHERACEKLLLKYIGFDFDKGSTGETEHPFTLNFSSKDVRVSNHFRTDNALDPMFSAIHEGGHAIFEQNVNPDYDGTVAGSCDNMSIHESQSRFFENILGRNINFWKPVYADVQETVPELKDISLDEFYREINHVRNSFIRTEADEVTYCLHIIIRYEIEKAIFREGAKVCDLPAMWNEKMQEYLGICPKNDAEGILQDMHWSDGSFGYFPTYLLGNILDGMFLEKITEDLGDVDEILAEGRILDITHWLNKNVHVYGNTRDAAQLIKELFGKELTAAPILRYFTDKYTALYNL